MARKDRLHRSELAVPGTNVRAMEKAPTLGADIVFLDLEDAVAPDDKEPARANVIEALLGAGLVGCAVSVRDQRPGHALVLSRRGRGRGAGRPRARHRADPQGRLAVATSSSSPRCWTRSSSAKGWEPGRIAIHILIETAQGHGQRRGDLAGRGRTAWRRWCSASRTTRRASRPAPRTSAAPTPTTRC